MAHNAQSEADKVLKNIDTKIKPTVVDFFPSKAGEVVTTENENPVPNIATGTQSNIRAHLTNFLSPNAIKYVPKEIATNSTETIVSNINGELSKNVHPNPVEFVDVAVNPIQNANFDANMAKNIESNKNDDNADNAALINDLTNDTESSSSSVLSDSSEYPEYDQIAKQIRMNIALEIVQRHLSSNIIDPFDVNLRRAFLQIQQFPREALRNNSNHKFINGLLPDPAKFRVLDLGQGCKYTIAKLVGRGTFGRVYKACDANTGDEVALKYIKPLNVWEAYICIQIQRRLKPNYAAFGIMGTRFSAIIAQNALLLGTEFSKFGTLVEVYTTIRSATGKIMHEALVMHFASQICQIVHELHKMKIIHADIKPDNFILMRIPSIDDLQYPSLRLIDYDRSIDMTLFGERKFSTRIDTEGFICPEMLEMRPWSYETDLFCVSGTVHFLLFGKYMEVEKRYGTWRIKQRLPRYFKKPIWDHFFRELLNIDVLNTENILKDLRHAFLEETMNMEFELKAQMRTLSNVLRNL